MTEKQKQALALKLAREVQRRHCAMIASEYRKAIRAAKQGAAAGDPTFMREQFQKDLLRDLVQVACAVAEIPVPTTLV